MKQSFFLRDRCLGSREVEDTWAADSQGTAAGARFRYTNLAFCCPACGEIWGRVLHDRAMPEWLFTSRHCPKHQATWEGLNGWKDWLQGSFIAAFPEHADPLNFSEDWPEAVVRHEFKMLMKKV